MARPFPRPFGKYTLLASLGRGGMGEVFAASLRGSIAGVDKRCVIKTVHVDHEADPEHVGRFLDEARLAVRLNHRNICPVFDVGVIDGKHYLAMELVRGRDLRTLWKTAVDSGVRIERGATLQLIVEVLDGLDYAHHLTDDRGDPLDIVHRDVSPQNIMLGFDGDVKLIDFGLAASTMKVERTETNVVLGKVPYMPPEQVRGERPDARADVFAVAIVLYEFLTGRRFYDGVDPYNLPAIVANGSHTPPGFTTMDPDLRVVLRRALEHDRNRRTRTAGLFAEELRIYAQTHAERTDATALRRLMRDVFGTPRDPWEAPPSAQGPPGRAAAPPPVDASGDEGQEPDTIPLTIASGAAVPGAGPIGAGPIGAGPIGAGPIGAGLIGTGPVATVPSGVVPQVSASDIDDPATVTDVVRHRDGLSTTAPSPATTFAATTFAATTFAATTSPGASGSGSFPSASSHRSIPGVGSPTAPPDVGASEPGPAASRASTIAGAVPPEAAAAPEAGAAPAAAAAPEAAGPVSAKGSRAWRPILVVCAVAVVIVAAALFVLRGGAAASRPGAPAAVVPAQQAHTTP